MSGLYPDVPGHRVPYDRNGAIAFRTVGASPVPLSGADHRAYNNETVSELSAFHEANCYSGVIFHDTFILDGYWLAVRTNGFNTLEVFSFATSLDTTNGLDGTWVTVGPGSLTGIDPNGPPPAPGAYTFDSYGFNGAVVTRPNFRTHIVDLGGIAAKAVRFRGRGNFESAAGFSDWRPIKFHLYGTPQGPTDRLAIWHPTADTIVGGAYFDWGDVAVPSNATRDFRVKNLSPATANSVAVGIEALTEGSPPVAAMHTFSLDGGTTQTPSLALGNLAPGEISDVCTLCRAMPTGAPAGLWAQRVVASSASFG